MTAALPLALIVAVSLTVWLLAAVRRALREDEADRYLREPDYDPITWAKREFPSRTSETLPDDQVIRSVPWGKKP